jgi:hypothetical protein
VRNLKRFCRPIEKKENMRDREHMEFRIGNGGRATEE